MADYTEQRAHLTAMLDRISADVTEQLEDVGLSMPIFLVVPSTGSAVVTVGTPGHPSDDDWEAAGKIVIDVVASHLGGNMKLIGNELSCAAAGSAKAAGSRRETAT